MRSVAELKRLKGVQRRMLLYLNDPSARVYELGQKMYLKRQSGSLIGVKVWDVEHLLQIGLLEEVESSGESREMTLSADAKILLAGLDPQELKGEMP